MVQARRKTGKQKDPAASKVASEPQPAEQSAGEPACENTDDDCPDISSPSSSDSSSSSSCDEGSSSSSSKTVFRKPASKVSKKPAISKAQQATQQSDEEVEQAASTMQTHEEDEPSQACEPVGPVTDTWIARVASYYWFGSVLRGLGTKRDPNLQAQLSPLARL